MDDIAAAAEISKGGIYFHFPTKESIFRELMRTTAAKLIAKVESAVAVERDPISKAEVALRTVLEVFAGHRTMARLFFEAGGAGRGFQTELNAMHDRFARLIQSYLDAAVADGAIPPIDTRITSVAWFGALDEVVAQWLLASRPGPLEDAYPTLRAILLRSVGVPEARIGSEHVELVPQLALSGGQLGRAQEVCRRSPLGDVGVGTAGNVSASEGEVRREERVGERVVHPAQQLGIRGGVRSAVGSVADDSVVDAAHGPRDRLGRRDVGERGDDQPLGGAPEPPDRVGAVGGVLGDTGDGSRLQRLHHQGADPADEGGEGAVHDPGRSLRFDEAVGVARCDPGHPGRSSVRVAREQAAERARDHGRGRRRDARRCRRSAVDVGCGHGGHPAPIRTRCNSDPGRPNKGHDLSIVSDRRQQARTEDAERQRHLVEAVPVHQGVIELGGDEDAVEGGEREVDELIGHLPCGPLAFGQERVLDQQA